MRLLRLLKKDLAREAEGWVKDGIVDKPQANQILSRYGATLDDAREMSVGYWALTGLSVLFAGLALIVFVSANWDDIPRAVRMLSLISLTAATGSLGAVLFIRGKEKAGTLWLLFGGISYGVSIMLIAQIYHLGEHYPDGIFYWALGVLPLVYLTGSRLIALLMLVLASIWMIVEVNENFFPWIYPLFAGSGLWLCFFRRQSSLLFLGAIFGLLTWFSLLIAWLHASGRHFDGTEGLVPFNLGISLLLLGLAHRLMTKGDRMKDYSLVLFLWLLRGLLVFMVVFSFEDTFEEFDSFRPIDWWLALLLPILSVIGFILARGSIAIAIAVAGAILTASFVLTNLADPLVAAVLANLLLLMTGIWLIRRGVHEGATHYYYTGIVVLLVTALCRYIDLIGDYVGASLMFLVAAGILFFSARFWKKRLSSQGEVADEE